MDDAVRCHDVGLRHLGAVVEHVRAGDADANARLAVIDADIERFPKGYDTEIGERGVMLSGGQKQRISIARAIMKDAPVLTLDDCLSAVDAKTEHEIIGNLYRFLHDKTAIIITHRIFSSFRFDNIIVLDNGGIAEQGTHDELIAGNGYYAELYRLQLTERRGAESEG